MPPTAAEPARPAGAPRLPGDAEVKRRSSVTAASTTPTARPDAVAERAPASRADLARRPGLIGWLCGRRSQGASAGASSSPRFVFFALAACSAALMRISSRARRTRFLGPDLYNQLFTMHGTTMMFLFAVPVMQALGALLRAADDRHAQHRLPAPDRLRLLDVPVRRPLSLRVRSSLNTGPDAGWFAYVPLAGPQYAPGKRADFWAQLITFTEVVGAGRSPSTSSTTIFKHARARA